MLYSKTAKYAVLALAEVALCPPEQPVSTKRIAASSSVPYPLLAKIVGQLRLAGLVDVVLALDGPDILNDCPLFLAPCNCEKECTMHPLWKPAHDLVVKFFEGTTLQDIADARQAAKESCAH